MFLVLFFLLSILSEIVVAHKDRLVRFGFEWFERFLKTNGVELIVVNNEKMSPQEYC